MGAIVFVDDQFAGRVVGRARGKMADRQDALLIPGDMRFAAELGSFVV